MSCIDITQILFSLGVWLVASISLFFILAQLDLLGKRIAAAVSMLIMLIYGIVITHIQAIPSSSVLSLNLSALPTKRLESMFG